MSLDSHLSKLPNSACNDEAAPKGQALRAI